MMQDNPKVLANFLHTRHKGWQSVSHIQDQVSMADITPPSAARVSLPAVPLVEVTRDRPETDPRADVITPVRKSLSIEERIEVIRQMWIKTRATA